MSITEKDITDIYPRLYAYTLNLTKDDFKAKDIVQSSILKALENKDRWSDVRNLSAWLITICKNTFKDSVQKKREEQFSEDSGYENYESNTSAEDSQSDKILNDCIKKIKEERREVFLMSYINKKGMSTKEISEKIKKPQNTVLTWLAKSKKEFIECVEA